MISCTGGEGGNVERLTETIRHEGSKWILYNKAGTKVLGKFDTEAEAKKREGQIQYFKHKNAKEGEDMPVEKTENTLRFRQTPPGQYKRFAVQKIAPGIEFVLGIDDKGKSEAQSVVFDKDKFTLAQAKKWLSDHNMKTGEGAGGVTSLTPEWVHEELLPIGEMHNGGIQDMEDDELRDLRTQMADNRDKLRGEHMGMDDGDRYSTVAGRRLLDDIDYYSRLIASIEYEMQVRYLEL